MKRFFVCLSIFLFVFSGIAIAEEKAKVPNLKIPSAEVLKSVNQELVTATVGDPKTFNPITSSETSSSAIYGKKIEAKIINDFTIQFILPVRFAPFLSVMQWPILPEFVLGESLKNGTFESQWNISTNPKKLIGTGPYKLVEYESTQHAKYERNPHYWKKDEKGNKLPYIEKRTILIVQDANTAFLKFKKGETHFYSPSPEYVAELEDNQDKLKIVVKEIGIGLGVEFLVFNRNPKYYKKEDKKTNPKLLWFEDLNFLKAVNHAIDKESIIVSVLYGMGKIAPAIIAPSNHIFTNKDLKDYKYDPDLAEEILEKAGYIDRDNDGIREDENGSKLEFDLSTNAGNNTREKLCSIIKQDLEDIGIKVNFRPLEFNTLVQKLMDNYEWDAIVIGLTGGSEPHNGANVYKSSGKLHVWNPAQEKPATKWEEELDRLVSQGAQELDLEKRIKIYHHLQEILHENLPFIVLPRSISYTAYNKNIENYFSTVFGTYKLERIFLNK